VDSSCKESGYDDPGQCSGFLFVELTCPARQGGAWYSRGEVLLQEGMEGSSALDKGGDAWREGGEWAATIPFRCASFSRARCLSSTRNLQRSHTPSARYWILLLGRKSRSVQNLVIADGAAK
jgi:hypothetical protein